MTINGSWRRLAGRSKEHAAAEQRLVTFYTAAWPEMDCSVPCAWGEWFVFVGSAARPRGNEESRCDS
jgi:hypothetical protein